MRRDQTLVGVSADISSSSTDEARARSRTSIAASSASAFARRDLVLTYGVRCTDGSLRSARVDDARVALAVEAGEDSGDGGGGERDLPLHGGARTKQKSGIISAFGFVKQQREEMMPSLAKKV